MYLQILNRLGFNVGFSNNPNYYGVFDPLLAEDNADLLKTVIAIANDELGLEALPEEAAHLILAGLQGHKLKERLDAAFTDDVVREVLGEEYDRYKKKYADGGMLAERLREEAAGKMLARMLRGENIINRYENQKNNNILTINRNEYADEFRRVQEESLGLDESEVQSFHRGRKELDELEQRILGATYERLLSGGMRNGDKFWTDLIGKGNIFKVAQVNSSLFYDIFQINRNYLKCYLTSDGMAGFAVEANSNLVSVFSLNPANLDDKKGFLYAIKDFVREQGATHLDAYASNKQNLEGIYTKTLGFKTASRMEYNMRFDRDDIAKNHGNPDVVFMVYSQKDIVPKRFDKNSLKEPSLINARIYREDTRISIPPVAALFELNSSEVPSSAKVLIEEFAKVYCQTNKEAVICVDGYTCDLGSDSLNNVLSAKRANAVKQILVSAGVPSDKITAKGYGSSMYGKLGIDGREANRRANVAIK